VIGLERLRLAAAQTRAPQPHVRYPLKLRIVLAIGAFLLTGCVTHPDHLGTPVELIGTVTNPVFTGWYRDFCEAGQLRDSSTNCIQIGGEIYRVTLLDARTLEGKSIAHQLIFGFPAHALPRHYRSRKRVRLQTSPDDFRMATGIEYLAGEWDDTEN
jgi:hypothetical protein